MSRTARKKSESGIYHVMLRGINKQQIFTCEKDYEKFIFALKDCKQISKFKLYAYCLMGNHIHLLIKEEDEPIGTVIKRIGCKFVFWYNVYHNRCGHLFQDRFKSEPVETDSYFLTVLRYIHQNPVKAGICKNIGDYKYSSYTEYVQNRFIVDTDFAFELLPPSQFESFNQAVENAECLEVKEPAYRAIMTEESATEVIQALTGIDDISTIKDLAVAERDNYVKLLRDNGLSIRMISKLTGIADYTVRKI